MSEFNNDKKIENADVSNEQTITESKEDKKQCGFDNGVDKTAGFIKKYKIHMLCGILVVIGIFIGLALSGVFSDKTTEVVPTKAPVATTAPATPNPTIAPTETAKPTAKPTEAPETVAPQAEGTPMQYSSLLGEKVYFEKSVDLQMSKADTISLLNKVLKADTSTIKAGDIEGVSKIADTVSVDVTKAEMLALLNDTKAEFKTITQSISGNTLTLDVDMSIQIPEEVLNEIKNGDAGFVVQLALSALTTDLSFSYTVSYDMDGEKLNSIAVSESTIDIAGLGGLTDTVAGIALSGYSDADPDTLLVGYNNMAGEIIADILNNYGIITGATADSINVTTRTK